MTRFFTYFSKKGNKAHSCGIHLAPNTATAIKYAACAIQSLKYDKVNVSSLILFIEANRPDLMPNYFSCINSASKMSV